MVVHGYLLSFLQVLLRIITRDPQSTEIWHFGFKGDEFHIRDCIIALFMERSDYPFVKEG